MGAGSSTTKKKANPNKKTDKLAFAENPGMYKDNMKDIPQQRNIGKHTSIVLQRRYRDDSIAEESISIRTETPPKPKPKATPVVPVNKSTPAKPKPKAKSTTKKPTTTNNTVKPKDKPIKIKKVKEPSIEEDEEELPPVVVDKKPQLDNNNNPRQRRYRPFQPIGNPKNRTRQRLLRKPINNNTTAPSVVSSVDSLSDDNEIKQPVDTNYRMHRPRLNNTTFSNFNRTYRTTTRTGFCQCDSNTCRQCGLTRMNNASSCCCSCSCSCYQNRCSCPLQVSHYRSCPFNHSTPLITYNTMPKVIKEKTYVIKDLPRINYVPVREPVLYNVPYRSSLYKWNVKVNGEDIGLRLPNVLRYNNDGFRRYASERKFDVLSDNGEDDEIRSAVVITPRYNWSTLSYG